MDNQGRGAGDRKKSKGEGGRDVRKEEKGKRRERKENEVVEEGSQRMLIKGLETATSNVGATF